MSDSAAYYRQSPRRQAFHREDVLAGRVIRINPALITLLDGQNGAMPSWIATQHVLTRANHPLQHKIETVHVDIVYPDFGGAPPTDHIFTLGFVITMAALGVHINLHLLTYDIERAMQPFLKLPVGAICFQLDAATGRLPQIVAAIEAAGICPSPVIETVGTPERPPLPPEAVAELLTPLHIDMLTIQAAGTASRSDQAAGTFDAEAVRRYLAALDFAGVLQLQGGITIETVPTAVRLGADLLVCGTQLFKHPDGIEAAIDAMLVAAADTLRPTPE